MRKAIFNGAVVCLLLTSGSSRADMSKLIAGSVEILGAELKPRNQTPLQADATPVVWVPPLMNRPLRREDKTSDLSADLRDIILRVEGIYDPTRIDGMGLPPGMVVRAGTASMNNLFADQWSIADTDANVSFSVSYIAYAWHKQGVSDCRAFSKRTLSYGDIIVAPLDRADCTRIQNLSRDPDNLVPKQAIVAAALPIPAFAAPEPGARLSSRDFWAAQQMRIRILNANLQQKRQNGYYLGGSPQAAE